MYRIAALFVFLTCSAIAMSQDFSVELKWQKMERSRDANRQEYTFDVKDSLMTYTIVSRGRGSNESTDSSVVLSSEQLGELKSYVKGQDLKKQNISHNAVDSFTAITVTSTIVDRKDSYFIRMSCGAEDNFPERKVAEDLFYLLKSFIPRE